MESIETANTILLFGSVLVLLGILSSLIAQRFGAPLPRGGNRCTSNPPAAKKYGYWTNDKKSPSAEAWLTGAKEHAGSWWHDWEKWLAAQSGGMVPARKPGSNPKFKAIEDAPGSYVKARAV